MDGLSPKMKKVHGWASGVWVSHQDNATSNKERHRGSAGQPVTGFATADDAAGVDACESEAQEAAEAVSLGKQKPCRPQKKRDIQQTNQTQPTTQFYQKT